MKLKYTNKYRCKCGRLLFKGNIILSSIEVKCKRCGCVNFFQDDKQETTVSFSITTDSVGKIIDTCRLIFLIGAPQKYFLGKNIRDFFPFVVERQKTENFARISHNFHFLDSNRERPIESYVIPRSENGRFGGWQIFNKFFNG